MAGETPIEVVWEGDRRYRGGPEGGATLVLDGGRQASASPVEAVVIAIASCSAIDVVDILTKRRTPPSALRARIEYTRAAEPPRRLLEVDVRFTIATEAERPHVERALDLSFEKYCSVSASLAPDVQLRWSLELEPGEAVPSPS